MLSIPKGEEKGKRGERLMDWKTETALMKNNHNKMKNMQVCTDQIMDTHTPDGNHILLPLILSTVTEEAPGWTQQQMGTGCRNEQTGIGGIRMD